MQSLVVLRSSPECGRRATRLRKPDIDGPAGHAALTCWATQYDLRLEGRWCAPGSG